MLAVRAFAQVVPEDNAYKALTNAFAALRSQDYDKAISLFREAEAVSPQDADIHKNLAYVFLKIGDSDGARDEFNAAMHLDPADTYSALEYAFLTYEVKTDASAHKAEARRIFARIANDANADTESRSTAAAALRNIDEPLRSAIERWQSALANSPAFSGYYELAQLFEQRDEAKQSAASYRAAFRLLPERRSVLLDIARVEKADGNSEGAMAALIAASRGPEPRTAEIAREQLPDRYPYVYEFRQALELDPGNTALRKELAWLLLRMSEDGSASREDAEHEFAGIVAASPDDFIAVAQLGLLYLADRRNDLAMPLLNRALASDDADFVNRVRTALHMPPVLMERNAAIPEPVDPRVMGDRSYQAGFLQDALRYFTEARETNPLDASLALKLGSTNNLLHDDTAALRWFAIAAQSDDAAIAAEAKHALNNLRQDQSIFRTTVWLYPLYSSRWGDLFGYGQLKSELRLRSLPLHPYISVRLMGDVRRTSGGPFPQSLSESAFVTALGIAGNTWHGATLWFEAGAGISYLNGAHWSDYRGGISYTKIRGADLAGERTGWFLETDADDLYVSHFDKDVINYLQSRAGYTISIAQFRAQAFWNQDLTFDTKRQYWANFVETGPGFRVHPPHLPSHVWINISAMRGVYVRNEGNPGRPNFYDFRAGIWYAFTK